VTLSDKTVTGALYTRKLSYRKNYHAMRPIYGYPFRKSLSTPTATFAAILMGFCSFVPINVLTNFVKVRSFAHSWDNRRYSKIWAVPGYAHSPFSPKFFTVFCSDGHCECSCQICSLYSFTRSCDNSDCILGLGLRTPNLGKMRP